MRQAYVSPVRPSGKAALPFKAVLLYQDVATGVKGKQIADFVVTKLAPVHSIGTALRNIASIQIGSSREVAADQAVEADIFILSLRDGHGMSSSLRVWINQWIMRRRGTPSAMVVLFESAGTATDFVRRHLRNAARRAGMDFFTQTGHIAESEIQADEVSLAV